MVINISQIRKSHPAIICLGSHRGIIQSILDFDFLAGRSEPSIMGVLARGRRTERYFFGPREVVVPVFPSVEVIPEDVSARINLFLNLGSGRRVLSNSKEVIEKLPNLLGGVVFAEGVPERHAIDLAAAGIRAQRFTIGGSSVGLIIPGVVKLGAIGGVQATQLEQSKLLTPGTVAVISTSGGMVNEIIRTVTSAGHAISFALALGGERFPMLTPQEAFLSAEQDPNTKTICYFGELGGTDEYVLADLITSGQVTKPVVAHIAGSVAELFDTPPQFGHAKAIANRVDESAAAKVAALQSAGANVAPSYSGFVNAINSLPKDKIITTLFPNSNQITDRVSALFANTVSGEVGGEVRVLNESLLDMAEHQTFGRIAISMFLGHQIKSKQLEDFSNYTLRLLVDHGPYVSGAVNTMVAARAGKDLVSSLASGLLTIGPRFGGATGQAAAVWFEGATGGRSAAEVVEEQADAGRPIPGIGHRKYRADNPDPRVSRLLKFAEDLPKRRFTQFALAVESITLAKKANLILNVDGAIAAVLLDLLSETEGYSDDQLRTLIDTDFFNALFVLSRSVGFMAHYFDQVRLDEGLFRLSPAQVANVTPKSKPSSDK